MNINLLELMLPPLGLDYCEVGSNICSQCEEHVNCFHFRSQFPFNFLSSMFVFSGGFLFFVHIGNHKPNGGFVSLTPTSRHVIMQTRSLVSPCGAKLAEANPSKNLSGGRNRQTACLTMQPNMQHHRDRPGHQNDIKTGVNEHISIQIDIYLFTKKIFI